MSFTKAVKHFRTITKHRHKVIYHCAKVGILWQGLRHDLSKYTPTEFWQGVRFFDGTHSPTEDERRTLGFSLAWMHHKGRNRHHFEFWTDYDPNGSGISGVEMPKKYVAEMFCDRLAASKVYRGKDFDPGDPYKFFLRGKQRRLLLHPNTEVLLETILLTLKDEGEDAAFDYVRREVLGK